MSSRDIKDQTTGPSQELSNGELVRRLLKLSWKYKWGCIEVLALQIVLLSIGLLGLGLTGLGIDYIRQQVNRTAADPHWPPGLIPPQEWLDRPYFMLSIMAGAIVGFAGVRGLINFVYQIRTANLLQAKIVVDLRSAVYSKMQRLSFRFFDENESGSIINRVTTDVQATRLFIDGVLIQGLMMILSLAVYLIYMISLDALLTLACMATTPLLYALSVKFSRVMKPAYRLNRELLDKLVLVLSETIRGVRVIKGFAREHEATVRFTQANQTMRDQAFSIFRDVAMFGPAINVLTQCNLGILLVYGGYLVIQGELPLGTGLVVFCGLLQQFSGQISTLVNLTNQIQDCLSAARRVFEVLDAPIEIQSPPHPKPLAHRTACTIEFEHVTFGYKATDPVLCDVSFRAEAGEIVAVVGATGSGKSSLLSLIPRFYDPQQGKVRINGIDVREIDLDDLRANVGIVFQENFLFSNSISANIAFGHPDCSQEMIEKAAKVAAADDFIREMPQGYDTILGESGTGISGGQRQRIAIARAILLEPSILLLDDPTAAIDAHTEHEIMTAMENAMMGRSTFIVAHRMSTLRRADRILVFSKGRLIQTGTHEQLMAAQGPYHWMIGLQIIDDESRQVLAEQTNGGREP